MDMSTPLFLRIDFLIRLNLMKKGRGGGGGSFLPCKDRYSFPSVYNSVISRSPLVCVCSLQPTIWDFISVSLFLFLFISVSISYLHLYITLFENVM